MPITCERLEQLMVFLENRPGVLADLCAHFSDREINIRAITTVEAGEAGVVRLVVDRPDDAKRLLSEAGVTYTTSECLVLEMPNYPGGFAQIARVMAYAGVNIEYIYATTTKGAQTALGIFGVSDMERVQTLDWEIE